MERWSQAVREKADQFIADDKVQQDDDYPDIWWVQGGDPERRYRVQFSVHNPGTEDESVIWVTCTCAFGLRKGAGSSTCSHALAALTKAGFR